MRHVTDHDPDQIVSSNGDSFGLFQRIGSKFSTSVNESESTPRRETGPHGLPNVGALDYVPNPAGEIRMGHVDTACSNSPWFPFPAGQEEIAMGGFVLCERSFVRCRLMTPVFMPSVLRLEL
ncbi:hypothetical protein ZHAS_00008602 [Anopheles sinensis]|uniref:Uncharacterized protein n=1 Tax=Anopheles sinensis TaxID=74873 RepID=A0A084VSP6_ANOSI|nr:hypothetical protein ZHAS_00008602 [Anopheles sinensis]